MKYLNALLLLILFSGCATKKVVLDNYESAMNLLKIGNYSGAAEMFEKIEDLEPFSENATKGLIMSAYSYYRAKQYEDSIRIIDYFIQSNPIDENIAYMQYLKGLNYYDRISSMAKARDITERANVAFNELIYKFPNTKYIEDASKKLGKVETYLSGNEMNVANYYLKRKNYIGAMNHFINVVNRFPKSKFAPEAIYRLLEISLFLNLKLEAAQYYQMLNNNYNDTVWFKYSTKTMKQYEKK